MSASREPSETHSSASWSSLGRVLRERATALGPATGQPGCCGAESPIAAALVSGRRSAARSLVSKYHHRVPESTWNYARHRWFGSGRRLIRSRPVLAVNDR
jgi:hypothetical protein